MFIVTLVKDMSTAPLAVMLYAQIAGKDLNMQRQMPKVVLIAIIAATQFVNKTGRTLKFVLQLKTLNVFHVP